MARPTLRATKPFRLSHHPDFPGSITVPDPTLSTFNARVPRAGSHECWPIRQVKGFRPYIPPNLQRYFIVQWTDEWGFLQSIPAHRLALLQDIGPIPSGLYACHRCAVPSCMNPRHLYAGTPKQNAEDRVRMETVQRLTGGRKVIVMPMRRRLICDAVQAACAA